MIAFDDNTWLWIDAHITDNPDKLRLKYASDPTLNDAVNQIDCRQRTASKLAVTLTNKRFRFPSTISAEQCTGDAIASIHAEMIAPGSKVLDMTCGLGIDTFHIATGAAHVTACEINAEYAEVAEYNARTTGLENVKILNTDSVEYLRSLPDDSYDCIFIDPARRGEHGERVFAIDRCTPDVTSILPKMLSVAPTVIIKASPMLDVSHTIASLTNVAKVTAIGTDRECKELVIECRRNHTEPPILSAMTILGNVTANETTTIEFTQKDENNAMPETAPPVAGGWIYEPYAPVLKIAPFRYLCEKFGATKLDVNTHLYTAITPLPGFPGREMRITEVLDMNKRNMRDLSKRYPCIDVTTRNLPIKAAELTARLKVKPSGRLRLFGCTCQQLGRIMIVTEP